MPFPNKLFRSDCIYETIQQSFQPAARAVGLQDIGLVHGTVVKCLGASPLGDPSAYLIRGAVIALRSQDAAGVLLDGPAV